MKYGLDVPTTGEYANPRLLAELAVEAEEAGWDGFFIWDVFNGDEVLDNPNERWIGCIDSNVALAAIATRTRRIRIGAFMTPLARRRPWKVAREAIALDHLSNGRLIFGAALGMETDRYWATFGEQMNAKTRAEMLDEGLEILQGLWTGEAFSFDGKHYHIDNAKFLPKPVQSPCIPIWLAGGWPKQKPLRRAAQWDGIYLMTLNQVTGELLTIEELKAIVNYLKAHRQSSQPFDIAINLETPSDPYQAAEIVKPYLEAGATWTIEYEGSRNSLAGYRERIRSGPPRI